MEKKMEKEKNIYMEHQYLKENIETDSELEKEKSIMIIN